eukprot:gnl/Spiro4/4966_TR2477_c0_g1_i1.p1 gnl/Spiro4/4966_TR2477_c0_g1~~gnl/Spiro4/4966_TR2477_c0_g1_i1.p1  ORF type:complete len:195 (+),score=28.97 gnl/Spiro4/4966_TR2477_c0_g1_i1:551-1135(+)
MFRRAVLPTTSSSNTSLPPHLDGSDSHNDWSETIRQMEDIVFPAIRQRRDKSNDEMKRRHDASHKLVSFKVGSYVMVKDTKPSSKLAPRFEGPFKVVHCSRGGAYLLQDTDGTILQRTYAPSQMLSIPTQYKNVPSDNVFVVRAFSAIDGATTSSTLSGGKDPSFFDLSVISNYFKSVSNASSTSTSTSAQSAS